MTSDLDALWNSCVDETCPGVGARHMYVLISFQGTCSNGGVLHAVESVLEDEADADPDYTFANILDACEWAQSDRTWDEVTALLKTLEAAHKALSHSATLSDEDAADYLDKHESQLDSMMSSAGSDDWLNNLLAHKYQTAPKDFA